MDKKPNTDTRSFQFQSTKRMESRPLLPDPAICRAKIIVEPDLVGCLVAEPRYCPYAMNYGGACFCNNPKKLEIVKIREGGKQKESGDSQDRPADGSIPAGQSCVERAAEDYRSS